MKRLFSFAIVITMLCMTFAIDTLYASPPSTQATNIAFSNVTATSARITVTRGNGSGRIIVVRLATDGAVAPTDGNPYTVSSSNFSSPDATTGAGNAVLYSGTARAVLVTGLSAGKQYTVTVYERNGSNEYNTSAANNNPRSFYTVPPAPTAGAYTNITSSSFKTNWTPPASGTFDGYIMTVADNSSFSPALNWYSDLSLGSAGSSYVVESVSTPPSTTIAPNTYYWARIRSTQYDKMSAWVNLGSVVTLPVAPTLSSSSATICQGDGYTITPIGPTPIGSGASDHRFNLYTVSSGGIPINGTPQVSFSITPSVTTTYYVATVSNYTGLESATRTSIAINVNPAAAPANAGADICQVGTLSATLSGSSPSPGTGTWTLVGGPGTVAYSPNANAAGASITVSLAGTYTFRWTVTVSGCSTTMDEVQVKFYPAIVAASIITGSPVNLCGSLSTTISAVNPGSGTGTWTYTSVNGKTLTFTPSVNSPNATITSNGYDSYNLTWTVTNPCTGAVHSTAGPLVVSFDHSPTASNAGSDQDLCASTGLPTTLATLAGNTPGANETGTWTASGANPGTVTFSNIHSPNSTAKVSNYGSYTFTWTISSQFGVCTPSTDDVMIGYYAPPTTAVSGGPYAGACGTMTKTLSGNTPVVGYGHWTVTGSPLGSTYNFDDDYIPNATFTADMYGTYTLVWTVATTDGICSPSTSTTTVSFQANVTTAGAGTDQNTCGLTTTLDGNTPTSGTGTWSVVLGNPGDISFDNSGNPTTGVTSTSYGQYSFKWTITNGTCTTMDTVGVIFWQPPTANAGSDQPSICAPVGGPYTATLGASPTVGTGTWSKVSGPGSVTFGDVNSNTSSFAASLPGAYELKWSVVHGTCSASDNVIITISENITPSAAGAINGPNSVCPSQTGVIYSVAPIANASAYNWTLPAGAAASGSSTGNTITVNFGTQSGNISVAGVNGCNNSGTPSTMAVSVTPTVGAAGTINGSNPVCANSTNQTYSVGTISGATSYAWTLPSGATFNGSSTGNMITVNFATASGNITVAGVSSCGTGTMNSLAISVQSPVGAAGTPIGSVSACANSTQNYSVAPIANATSYTWTVPGDAIITGGTNTNMITVNFGTTSGNVTVAGVNSCGTGSNGTLNVTIQNAVAAATTPVGLSTVCGNQTGVVYSVSTILNATSYTWSLPAGASFSGANNTNIITVNFGTNAGNVTVAGVNSCGTGSSAALAVSINPIPDAAGSISGASNVCANQTGVTYSVAAINNATSYVWTVPTGASIVGGSNTNMITVNFGTNSGFVSVYGTNGCGNGNMNQTSVSVTQQVATAGNPSGSTLVCTNQTNVTYSIATLPNADNYTWSVPTGASIVGGNGTNMITVNFGSSAVSGNISVFGSNSCFTGGTGSTFVTVTQPVANATTPSGNASVCANESGVTYSVAPISNATNYVWSVPAGASVTAGNGTNMITVNFGTSSGSVSVFGTNSCSTGGSASLAVTINPLPDAAGAINGTTSICANSTGIVYSVASIAHATSYTWTLPSGASFSGSSTGNSITVNFGTSSGNIMVAGVNTCGTGTSNSTTVIVSTSIVANAGSDQTIGGLTGTMSGNSASPGVGAWSKVSGSGNVTFSSPNSESSNVTVDAFGSYTFRWTITNGACVTWDDVNFTFSGTATQLVFQSIPSPKVTGVAFNVVVVSEDATNTPTAVLTNTAFTITENGAGSLDGGSVAGSITAGNSNSGNISVTYNAVDATVGESSVTLHVDDNGGSLTDNNSNAFNVLASEPTTQASNLNFQSVGQTTLGITWNRGNGSNVLIYALEGPSATTDNPSDGSSYTANQTYGNGSPVGSSYAIYNGTGTYVTFDGLNTDTRYAVKLVEYNGTGSLTNYNTSNGTNRGSQYTLGKDGLPLTGGDMNMSASTFKPNPAQDYVEFNLNLANSSDVTISIYDETGKRVMTPISGVNFVKGSTPVRINLQGLATGAYTVLISSNNEAISDKVVIKK